MGKHKKYSASKSSKWINCQAFIQLSAIAGPVPTSKYAQEGTAAHKVVELCLNLFTSGEAFEGEVVEGVVVDEEMVDGVNFYLDIIDEDLEEFGGKVYAEAQVTAPNIHPEIGGTVDTTIIPAKRSRRTKQAKPFRLRIYDFKYGRGVTVHAENNTQGLNYALCICDQDDWTYDDVEITIIQPRAPNEDDRVTSWIVTRQDLKHFKHKVLRAIEASQEADPVPTAGDWCRFCPAEGICPALHNRSLELIRAEFTPAPTDGINLIDPEELALDGGRLSMVLDNIPKVRRWMNGVEKYALSLAMQGDEVANHKLVEGRSNRKWINDKELVTETLLELGLKREQIPSWMNPTLTQIEKILRKKVSGEHRKYKSSKEARKFNKLLEKPPGKPCLVGLEDDRSPMSLTRLTEDDFIDYDD